MREWWGRITEISEKKQVKLETVAGGKVELKEGIEGKKSLRFLVKLGSKDKEFYAKKCKRKERNALAWGRIWHGLRRDHGRRKR